MPVAATSERDGQSAGKPFAAGRPIPAKPASTPRPGSSELASVPSRAPTARSSCP